MGVLILEKYPWKENMNFEKIESKIFSYYSGYFHDGVILDIKTKGDELSIKMESVGIYLCDNRDNIPLSERNTLYGILHARGVISLKENSQEVSSLNIKHEWGELIRFSLTESSFFLCGSWAGPGVESYKEEEWFEIEVRAKEIYWENTADMLDPALLGKYMGLPGKPPYGYPQWYIDKYGPQDTEETTGEKNG